MSWQRFIHRLSQSTLSTWAINWSQTHSLPGFRRLPIYEVVVFFMGQVRAIGMTERASAIAFNFVMAIPPAIIFLFTLIPYFPITQAFQEELNTLIKDVIPGEKDNSVLINFLNDFISRPRNGLLSVGFILSLFFSSNAMMGIMRSFDKNYPGFTKRKGWQKRFVALKITTMLYLFVIGSVALLVAREAVLRWFGVTDTYLIDLIDKLRWIVIVMLYFFCISFIYRYAPSIPKKWKWINPGSILATGLMLLMTLAFSWWVTNFAQYNQIYGSISTVLIIMILLFVNSLFLLIGFELNVSIQSLLQRAADRKADQIEPA
ncbi:MAG: YihY/virulence factor BrkB family protein [Bacteroidetes bacterium]|nr:YihY/virulence factor BrkB family protein [Bacteroidota bacterium]